MTALALLTTLALSPLLVDSQTDRPVLLSGLERRACGPNDILQPKDRTVSARSVAQLRSEMEQQRLHAYIVPYSDEHQNEWVHEHNQRLRWLSGFTGTNGVAAVTRRTPDNFNESAVLWTDNRFRDLADEQLDCEWSIISSRSPLHLIDWLIYTLNPRERVGADPNVLTASQWDTWYNRLHNEKSIILVESRNLVDIAWTVGRAPKPRMPAVTHRVGQAGRQWQSKVLDVRKAMRQRRVDGLVLTALDEIAWLLNIRGRDLPHAPLVTAYLFLTEQHIRLFIDLEKITPAIDQHLKISRCKSRFCVMQMNYTDIWTLLSTEHQSNRTTVWISNHPKVGASKAIQNAVRRAREPHYEPSPVIAMKSVKDAAEIEAMRAAHVRDGAVMCRFLRLMDNQIQSGSVWTESKAATELDHSRRPQPSFFMTAFPTHVGYGPHGAIPHYVPRNTTDLVIGKTSTMVIDSGGQYENGTTDLARTVHFGYPDITQVQAYTRVLQGLIEMSRASVPVSMGAHALDSLARAAVWESGENYGHPSGHGIGAFLNVHEEPNIFYRENAHQLQVGNFFTAEPGYYKKDDFGVRLENVLEVIEKQSQQEDGQVSSFLEFRTTTLVPFERDLIDVEMLSPQQRHWLNEYNARVRTDVGALLKNIGDMDTFYWMMNHTLYIPEHCCPRSRAPSVEPAFLAVFVPIIVVTLSQ